jgi:hypothetical protein
MQREKILVRKQNTSLTNGVIARTYRVRVVRSRRSNAFAMNRFCAVTSDVR